MSDSMGGYPGRPGEDTRFKDLLRSGLNFDPYGLYYNLMLRRGPWGKGQAPNVAPAEGQANPIDDDIRKIFLARMGLGGK